MTKYGRNEEKRKNMDASMIDIVQRAVIYAEARSREAERLMRQNVADDRKSSYEAGKSDAYDDVAVYLNGVLLELAAPNTEK
jgi:hypothetical protein